MSEGDTHKTTQASLRVQRRTMSTDEYSSYSLNANANSNEKKMNGASTNGKHGPTTKQNSEDDYVCATLPRTNNRPSARTCWRKRSAFAPSPRCNFGPKCTLKHVQNNPTPVVINDPSSQRLGWIGKPTNILVIRKPGQSTLSEFRILVEELLQRKLTIYIEAANRQYLSFDDHPVLKKYAQNCHDFHTEENIHMVDLIICLGGDGTLLHVSNLYQQTCPPILSFSMGSLGFLTPFDFRRHKKILDEVMTGDVPLLLRARLCCTLIKDDSNMSNETEVAKETTSLALNEVVIDRGPNSYLSNLNLYINDRFITKVQGDGLIISTATGSTAYAMAAGSSMVHPGVPAIVICPICPHSLSFRPIVVPAGIELTVKVSDDSRLSAWLSVDGRNRLELQQQDSVKITTSVDPVPSICQIDQLGDWFESLAKILHWNLRKTQLSLDSDRGNLLDESLSSPDEEEIQEESSTPVSVSYSSDSVDL